jgi:hypothetical protein
MSPTPVVIKVQPAQFDQLYLPIIATAAPVMIANGAMVRERGKLWTLDRTGLDPRMA